MPMPWTGSIIKCIAEPPSDPIKHIQNTNPSVAYRDDAA